MADRDSQSNGGHRTGTPRLLVVDDNRDILDMLTLSLGEKYSVLGCQSAAEALAALETSRPDLLMLDIRMSPVDGVQCLEAIRAIPGCADIPAIALTAFARDSDRQAFLAAGFQAVAVKPILDQCELEALIDMLLGSATRRSVPVLTDGSDNGIMSLHGGKQ
jgi:CheY-like chemotaxis protein